MQHQIHHRVLPHRVWPKIFDDTIAKVAALDKVSYCECLHTIHELDFAREEKST